MARMKLSSCCCEVMDSACQDLFGPSLLAVTFDGDISDQGGTSDEECVCISVPGVSGTLYWHYTPEAITRLFEAPVEVEYIADCTYCLPESGDYEFMDIGEPEDEYDNRIPCDPIVPAADCETGLVVLDPVSLGYDWNDTFACERTEGPCAGKYDTTTLTSHDVGFVITNTRVSIVDNSITGYLVTVDVNVTFGQSNKQVSILDECDLGEPFGIDPKQQTHACCAMLCSYSIQYQRLFLYGAVASFADLMNTDIPASNFDFEFAPRVAYGPTRIECDCAGPLLQDGCDPATFQFLDVHGIRFRAENLVCQLTSI